MTSRARGRASAPAGTGGPPTCCGASCLVFPEGTDLADRRPEPYRNPELHR